MTAGSRALVVGGGHNGLVAAHYLAAAGLETTVLEQRDLVGGLTTTEEIFPGFFAEPASQVAHGIEPLVYRDMRLDEYGIDIVRTDPYMVTPFPDGRRLIGWRSKKRMAEEIASFSEADEIAWLEYRTLMTDIAIALGISPLAPPPTIHELLDRASKTEYEEEVYRIIFGTIKEFFDDRFESEEVKTVLSLLATAFNLAGPMSTSPYMLLHWAFPQNALLDQNAETDLQFRGGTIRPKGGIGSITQAMERSLIDTGGVAIRKGAKVKRVIVEDGVALGVELASGEQMRADVVLVSSDPRICLLNMVGPDHLASDYVARLRRMKPNGSQAKFLVATRGKPRFRAAQSEEENDAFLRATFRFAPSMEYQERAYDDAKYGVPSRHPVLYGQSPTAIDPSLAPEGCHILNFTVTHAPYRLRTGTWKEAAGPFSETILGTLRLYFENLDEVMINHRLFTPLDIEERYGLPGGDCTQGPMTFRRLMGLYPIPNWQDHSSPIDRLFFCGAGTWPGGGVTGAPGYNGAQLALSQFGQPLSKSA